VSRFLTSVAATSALLSTVAAAAETQPAAPAAGAAASSPPSPTYTSKFDEVVHESKQPTSWWKWGADLRVRDEYFNNAITLNSEAPYHEQNYIRIRTRWWNTFTPVQNLDLVTRLTWEGREWTKPSFRAGHMEGFDWSEGIFDSMNVKWKEIGKAPVSLTAGRQDLTGFGDGWLILDGTPLDGSRTIYFDAARVTWDLKPQKTSIDFMYIDQGAWNDRWLPPINHQVKTQIENNERGGVVYVTHKSIPKTQLDGYVIFKQTEQEAKNGYDSKLFTMGARVAGDVGEHWKYRSELAFQIGDKTDPILHDAYSAVNGVTERDVFATGFNNRVSYLFKDPRNSQLRISYEYLTGDDPDTKRDEMFDSPWGRWPQWSELYIYSFINETRISQIANIHKIGPGFTFTPVKKLDFIADYYLLFADQEVPTRATTAGNLFTNDGNFRGHMVSAVLKYRHNEHLSAHLWSEFVFMGDYYTHRDMMSFIRAEVNLTW
jgi:hypothetical protein